MGRNLDADMLIGASKGVKASMLSQHWRYPQTVGADTIADDIHFNSDDTSEYAIKRMSVISEATHEPFMMFEMMTIDEEKAQAKIKAGAQQLKQLGHAIKNLTNKVIADPEQVLVEAVDEAQGFVESNDAVRLKSQVASGWTKVKDDVTGFITNSSTPAERNYTGSISLYMPTDIQINDTMVYNEDTRKLGAALNAWAGKEDGELVNWVTATDPAVLAAAGAAGGAIGLPAAVMAVIGGSIGTLVQTEMQRHTGKVMNPNELVRYAQTALRSFTFNWTILPDNAYESDQAAGLIKFFRKSAHAKRTSSTLVTVPDHVITSFHGAKDMIQLPPCYIENVNVTYNPNNSSFFRRNNAPVEIGLSVGLKEIIPIYAADVERGL